MGLFDKIKDILFVDDDPDIPVITKKEEVKEPVVKEQDNIPRRSIKRDVDVHNESISTEVKKEEEKKTSPFIAFDAEEFDRVNHRGDTAAVQQRTSQSVSRVRPDDVVVKTTTTNIKKVESKDYSRYEMTKTVEEKKPFRPSPVISPVYGILDKNYRKEDVVTKQKTENTLIRDVDSIRKKAFGELEDIEMPEIKKEPEKSLDELIADKFEKPTPEQNVELDDVIVNSVNEEDMVNDIEPIITHYDDNDDSDNNEEEDSSSDYQAVNEHTSALEILDEIEKELNKQDKTEEKKETLEGDLFNLIDSMYDNRKEEE